MLDLLQDYMQATGTSDRCAKQRRQKSPDGGRINATPGGEEMDRASVGSEVMAWLRVGSTIGGPTQSSVELR